MHGCDVWVEVVNSGTGGMQVRNVLQLYVDIEHTSRSNAFYEKYNLRYSMGDLLRTLPSPHIPHSTLTFPFCFPFCLCMVEPVQPVASVRGPLRLPYSAGEGNILLLTLVAEVRSEADG